MNKALANSFALATLFSIACYGQDIPDQPSRCKRGWRKELRKFRQAVTVWPDSDCYDFTFQQYCFCPPPNGPVQVSVRNGVVVAPVDENNVPLAPSMAEIFDTIYDNCFATCPEEGSASCKVTYATEEGGYATSVYIDPDIEWVDEEISYAISNFTFCNA